MWWNLCLQCKLSDEEWAHQKREKITVFWRIINQDNFFEELDWRSVDDGVDRPEQRGQGLVVEDDDDAGLR